MAKDKASGGKLKIGDHWNAITIIALSQNSPLKAIAEFVENAIDAKAANVTIIRGKQKNDFYLKIIDDGEGIKDFDYLATHIGDSLKRKLKEQGATGIQGEFGIGLLSFWTVGEECVITSASQGGKAMRMKMVKGNPGYSLSESTELFERTGTELHIQPILSGVRMLSGDKIQNYLASELRDRISKSGVRIRIVDRANRREFAVEPRKFHGRLLHGLPVPVNPFGEIYTELYLAQPSSDASVSLCRQGTRVFPDISKIEALDSFPWNSRYLEGIIDVPFLKLTPGTRDGVIYDDALESFVASMEPLADALADVITAQRKAEEEEASKAILQKVTKALKEAFMLLPQEEYGWLGAKTGSSGEKGKGKGEDGFGMGAGGPGGQFADGTEPGETEMPGTYFPEDRDREKDAKKDSFEFAGPLHKVVISPASCVIGVGEKRKLRAVCRDKAKRTVDSDLAFAWRIEEGLGSLEGTDGEFTEYTAPEEPGVILLEVKVSQGEIVCKAEALVTVTAELVPKRDGSASGMKKGLPGYTYKRAPGELWRSRYDADNCLVVINNAHADFIYASRQSMTKLRYIARLFSKELVLANFSELTREDLLERMVELTLYVEEHLK